METLTQHQQMSFERQLAQDHYLNDEQESPVNQMFNGRSVFITGASGFIGRVLLEKLLRCYQGIRRIYILMRAKKNMQPADRLHKQLLKVPIFDQIRAMKNGQELLDKIVIVTGDIGEHNWGICGEELDMMLNDPTLSIVFHSAATVRFDEPLKNSVKFNLSAVETLIKLCKRLPNLVALCHVSSAYVNSNLKDNSDIQEQLYPIDFTPSQVLQLADQMDESFMQVIKPKLVGDRPNTYTYTKALGEHLLAQEAADLPVAIVRPSIVVAAWKEPLPGWIDNLNGPTGLLLAYGKGLMRSMYARRDSKADIVPVDIVINCMIASAYFAAESHGKLTNNLQHQHQQQKPVQGNNNEGEEDFEALKWKEPSKVVQSSVQSRPPIFHCTSGDLHPFTWGNIEQSVFQQAKKYPSSHVLRYPNGTFKNNQLHDSITRLFVHFLPALLIDMICMLMGKKQQMLPIYQKLHSAMAALTHFSSTNYNFKSTNIKILQESLAHPKDRETLYMDITKLEWDQFWDSYVLGARRFVLKEDDKSLGEARRAFQRAYYKELAFRLLLTALALYCFLPAGLRLVNSVLIR